MELILVNSGNLVLKNEETYDDIIIYISPTTWNDYGVEIYFSMQLVVNDILIYDGYINIAFQGVQYDEYTYATWKKYRTIDSFYEEKINFNKMRSLSNEDYYESVNVLPLHTINKIHTFMNDIAYNNDLIEDVNKEYWYINGFLRGVSTRKICYELNKLAHGKLQYEKYNFSFEENNLKIEFVVDPESILPSNLCAIIGSNGVGKSFYLKSIFKQYNRDRLFDNVVPLIYCSYSIFDDNSDIKELCDNNESYDNTKNCYSYIGSYEVGYDSKELFNDFHKTLEFLVTQKNKIDFFEETLNNIQESMQFDINFLLDYISVLKQNKNFESNQDSISTEFLSLSSGYKIVLLIIIKLLSKVTENAIILLDEPENHLHPPLLSKLVSVISYIAKNYNCVAIFSTHSPIVIQEVVGRNVYKMCFVNNERILENVKINTLGENIGKLTRVIFSHEYMNSSVFSNISSCMKENDLNAMNEMFSVLGDEGQMIALSLGYSNEGSNND